MPASSPDIADIDAAIGRGQWWARLFDELSERGMERVEALTVSGDLPVNRVVRLAERLFRAVRMAVVASMGLDQILAGLAALRARSAADIAAAWDRARAKSDEVAAARQRAEERAVARRETPEVEVREPANDSVEGAKSEPRDRDPLVEALSKRLAAVDPAIVDFDDLQLRETVLRICADLGVTADWSRWEACDWTKPDTTPKTPAPAQAPPPRLLSPPVDKSGPGLRMRVPYTALARALQAAQDTAGRRTPKLE
jgi:hypothetical protein